MDIDFTNFTSDDLKNIVVIDKGFNRFERGLTQLEFRINDTKGAWIFKTHTYSKEELLEDPDVEKLISAIGTLGENILSWAEHGSISKIGLKYYFSRQEAFIERLRKLENNIINRPMHNWEKIKGTLIVIVKILIATFPVLETIGAGVAGILEYRAKVQRLLNSGDKSENNLEEITWI